MSLPPLPAWNAAHPLVVHFPIALLLAAPLFVLLGALVRRGARSMSVAALLLMTLGTAGAFVAVATGEAAADVARVSAAAESVLEEHEELGETTRTVFAVLTAAFAALVGLEARRGRAWGTAARVGSRVVFLLLYLAAALVLVDTAHHGGRLVHEFGVRAPAGPTAESPGRPAASSYL